MTPGASPPLTEWLTQAWARTAEVRAVEVEGAIVRYRGWGLDAVDRPGLVLVHGFIAHARWWDHIAPHFCDRFRVIAPDFTGMGDSDWRPAYSRRQYARETIAAARHAGFDRAILIAHSFGGVSSLLAAMLAPDLVERTIVVDAHVFREGPEREMERPQPRLYPTREAAAARYRLRPPGGWPVAEVLDHIARASVRQTPEGWTWKFDPETHRSVHRERISEDVRGQPLRVDVVRGDRSEAVGDAELRAFLDSMPMCGRPVTVPLSHHHIMIEQPVALVAALNGLLAQPHSARPQEIRLPESADFRI